MIVHLDSSTVEVPLASTESRPKISDDKFYYWYGARDIKRTRGGYSGKLLHGIYAEYYHNKNLKEKGRIKYGLKQGTWKSWHRNGEYNEVSHWKNGMKCGRYVMYSENGFLKESGKFKKGRQVGVIRIYTNGKVSEKVRYKRGLPKTKKIRAKKEKKHKNVANKKLPNPAVDEGVQIPDANKENSIEGKPAKKRKGKDNKDKKRKKKNKKEDEIRIRKMFKVVPLKNENIKDT
ncbi:MAG: toxin-antitoxin system YwqK family antitoxin [Cytophagaceae bacterium]